MQDWTERKKALQMDIIHPKGFTNWKITAANEI